jgi:hypothetical protein
MFHYKHHTLTSGVLTTYKWPPCTSMSCSDHYIYIYSFIHLVVCLTTGPKPLSKRAVHIQQSRASCFRCEYPLPSLRSSSSFLRLLPRLPVTFIPPFIFPSIICRSRQFVRKMWPIQLVFCLLISCKIIHTYTSIYTYIYHIKALVKKSVGKISNFPRLFCTACNTIT